MSKSCSRCLLVLVAIVLVPLYANATQISFADWGLPAIIGIGEDGHPDCAAYAPEGTSLLLGFIVDAWDESVPLTFEASQVTHSAGYSDEVYVNDILVGTLTTGASESDCTLFDISFSADIADQLVVGANSIEIRSGYNAGEDNYDDIWVQNFLIDGLHTASSVTEMTLSDIKVNFR